MACAEKVFLPILAQYKHWKERWSCHLPINSVIIHHYWPRFQTYSQSLVGILIIIHSHHSWASIESPSIERTVISQFYNVKKVDAMMKPLLIHLKYAILVLSIKVHIFDSRAIDGRESRSHFPVIFILSSINNILIKL